jgi:hypothetical protein
MTVSTFGSHFTSKSSSRSANRSGSLQCCQNVAPWSFNFIFRNRKKFTVGEVRWVGRLRDDCRIRRSQKLLYSEWHVSWNLVMIQGPGFISPLVWKFAPDVFPQSPQNITIEFLIHCLSWWNKFLIHYDGNVKICHIFCRGCCWSSSRTLFIIGWYTSVLETLKPFVGFHLA